MVGRMLQFDTPPSFVCRNWLIHSGALIIQQNQLQEIVLLQDFLAHCIFLSENNFISEIKCFKCYRIL